MRLTVPNNLRGDHAAQVTTLISVMPNGCWHYTGYIAPTGYGQVGRNLPAHRVAWEVANGRPATKGMHVDHQCHNLDAACNDDNDCLHRRCVNPAHLELVTPRINLIRGKGFGGVNAAVESCPQGHPYSEANTYYRPDRFGRICRACRYESGRRPSETRREEFRILARAERRRANPVDFAIRQWAIDAGLPCSMSGPISKAVREAYAQSSKDVAA